ncbi:MAG: type II toxin-antitoxin system RelE/ParE family toxin [Balneolaceae bacterium]|nr:MAG: type II toxin-antitoxin system RelE/ParE family toxin [Balneolaceae bacterium]
MEIVWTKQALQKLNKFVDYIARDDAATAEKWALKLIEKTDQLIEQPESGRIVPEYNEPNLRELIFGNYRVIYRIRKEENTIYIQTVWHVRQDPPKSSVGLR